MHNEKAPNLGVSWLTMQRYWQTWSLNEHACRQSSPALQVGSPTQSVICLPHLVTMQYRLGTSMPFVVIDTASTLVTYSLTSTRNTNRKSSLLRRSSSSRSVPYSAAARASAACGVNGSLASRDATGPRGEPDAGVQPPCSRVSAPSSADDSRKTDDGGSALAAPEGSASHAAAAGRASASPTSSWQPSRSAASNASRAPEPATSSSSSWNTRIWKLLST
mmetsp:Transcript_29670/g.87801  ORF Transcript_29670/g.87801 Transcript_29670/m.87801 type:complete len:220 (+) Transcript_29670:894-1553(+)